MGLTRHTQPINDATFTGSQSIRITNHVVGSTLLATLNVLGFVGGGSPSVRLRIFFVDDSGERVGGKRNQGAGIVIVPGVHLLVLGPGGANSTMGEDKNNGALPSSFDLEVDNNGDQTSTDVRLDVVLA